MSKYYAFHVEIPANDPQAMAVFQEMMNEIQDGYVEEIASIARDLNVSDACASDVWYLRSRSRHTPELEQELIRLHKAGTPPNVCEFG